ncbi:MAG: type II toxin-antitoxin system HicB family antitoxin [Pseudonocardiaceae bacterium]
MSTGYLVVLEGDDASGYSTYSLDLPGVIAAAATADECLALMREAMAFHIEGLIEDGDPVPQPTSAAAVILLDPAAA